MNSTQILHRNLSHQIVYRVFGAHYASLSVVAMEKPRIAVFHLGFGTAVGGGMTYRKAMAKCREWMILHTASGIPPVTKREKALVFLRREMESGAVGTGLVGYLDSGSGFSRSRVRVRLWHQRVLVEPLGLGGQVLGRESFSLRGLRQNLGEGMV